MTDNAQTFKWTGINSQGQHATGVILGRDLKEAQTELKKMGVEVITLVPKRGFQLPGRRKKIKVKDIQLFTRYLSTMMNSGLPILQSLDVVGRDHENPAMKNLILSLRKDISGGKTLAETFAVHSAYFNTLYCSLIKAGEKSGTLDKILNRLSVYLERTETLKRKIKKALIYPIAILTVAFLVSCILLIFVVPQFDAMFKSFGGELPYFTQMVVNLSTFMRHYWWMILGVIIGGIYFLRRALRTNERVQQFVDKKILKIYVVGPVLVKGIIARFTRTLATTMDAGMPIVESMKSMAPIMGNHVYQKSVLKMADDISSGHALSEAMTSTKLFPNMVIQMVLVGEASGRLPEMLTKIADYYEEEVNSVVDNLSSLLEPLIMVILGVIVGGFVVAMYLPIFRIGSLF